MGYKPNIDPIPAASTINNISKYNIYTLTKAMKIVFVTTIVTILYPFILVGGIHVQRLKGATVPSGRLPTTDTIGLLASGAWC